MLLQSICRDWEHIDCQNQACAWQRMEACTVPSLAKIGPDGKCKGFHPAGTLKTDKGDKQE